MADMAHIAGLVAAGSIQVQSRTRISRDNDDLTRASRTERRYDSGE